MTIRRSCAVIVVVGAALAVTGSTAAATGTDAETCTPETEARLNVNVRGVRNTEGEVAISVYSDRKSEFLSSGAYLIRHRVPVQPEVTRMCMPLPGPGTYAVAVYHDEDHDHDFDRTMVGLPAEGYGFSNDPDTLFSLPAFKDVLIDAPPGDTEITITMNYRK